MKKSIVTSMFLAAMLFGATAIMTSCGGKTQTQEQTTEEQQPAEEQSTDDMDMAEAKYACPMHPEVTGKEGDKCSKCNMPLEKVEDGADSTEMHDHH